MLLTITTTHRPAIDLGYLLHKHPARFQSFALSFGRAHVFYPAASAERCTACLLLDVDPVAIHRRVALSDLRAHLYVLTPVLDSRKHYYVGEEEMERLLARGAGWLAQHPQKEEITRRYLKFQPSLYREALARLVQEEEPL